MAGSAELDDVRVFPAPLRERRQTPALDLARRERQRLGTRDLMAVGHHAELGEASRGRHDVVVE